MNRRMADDNKLFREEFNVWRTETHTVPSYTEPKIRLNKSQSPVL